MPHVKYIESCVTMLPPARSALRPVPPTSIGYAISLSMLPLSILSAGNDPVLRAYPEHLRFLLVVRVVMVGFLLAGLWFGTAYFGLEGAIMAVVGVGFFERFVLTLKVSRVLGASCRNLTYFMDVGKVALASLAAAAAAAAVREWTVGGPPSVVLLSCGLAFAAAYVAAVLSLGILAPEEVQFIRRGVVSAERWMDCINTRGDHRPSGGLPLLLRRRIGFRRLNEGKSETDS